MAFIVDCKSQNCTYLEKTGLVTAYFDDIKKFPLLSSNEERKLLERAKSSNPFISQQARNRLVECNQRFVVSVARRLQKDSNIMDIISEGNLGLMHAIDNYDLNKKQRFITYAIWWIRKYINEYFILKDRPVVPANAIKLHTYVPKVVSKFYAENHRKPTISETKEILKDEYRLNVKHDEDLSVMTVLSIDNVTFSPSEEKSNHDSLAYIETTRENNIEDDIEKADATKMCSTLLSTLSDREREIVASYFGIECSEKNVEILSNKYGITKERVRQIIKESLKKMSNYHKINKKRI